MTRTGIAIENVSNDILIWIIPKFRNFVIAVKNWKEMMAPTKVPISFEKQGIYI